MEILRLGADDPASSGNLVEALLPMREALYPDLSRAENTREVSALFAIPARYAFFIALVAGEPAGFAEAAIRRDHVDGCRTSPVVFLEGIFVLPAFRRRGIARKLCEAVAGFGSDSDCSELASNALLTNHDSHAFHAAAGFEETERVVFFRRRIGEISA
jgi:Acetyltransferase (GNAT) family.